MLTMVMLLAGWLRSWTYTWSRRWTTPLQEADHLAEDHLAEDHLAEGHQQYHLWAPAVGHQKQEALEDVATGAGEAVQLQVRP